MNAPPAVKMDQDRRIVAAFDREAVRLGRFIRRRVSDAGVADDILQDVFSELLEAERLVQPIEQVSAWLFRVARNRITDWFRRRKPETYEAPDGAGPDGPESGFWEDALPSPDAGPEALYARARMLDELAEALAELPERQRAIFIAHEIEGLSFRDIAAQTGESVNTLLSRKHAAVQSLRRRLRAAYENLNIS
jgi:RNA polymerase sigma factor (sigma-70 family)